MFGTNFEPIDALGPKGGVKVKMFPNSDVATMSRIPLRERVSRNKIHFEQMGLANHDKYTPLGLFSLYSQFFPIIYRYI